MSDAPLLTTATITTLITAVIVLLRSFNVPLTLDQQVAITAVLAVIAPWIVAWVGHRTTTPLSNPKAADGEPLVRSSGSTRSATARKP